MKNHKLNVTGSEVCSSALWGVWFVIVNLNYCLPCGKSHEHKGKTGGNEHCWGARMLRTEKVCCWQCMGFLFRYFHKLKHTQFIIPEPHFHAELNRASPVIIACKMTKLFKSLQVFSKCKHAIVRDTIICVSYYEAQNFIYPKQWKQAWKYFKIKTMQLELVQKVLKEEE